MNETSELDNRQASESPLKIHGHQIITCPDCGHGIDPHGVDSGGMVLLAPIDAELEAIVRMHEKNRAGPSK